MLQSLRDLYRGYSASDLERARQTMHDARRGHPVQLPRRQFKALLANECIVADEYFGSRIHGMDFIYDTKTLEVWHAARTTTV